MGNLLLKSIHLHPESLSYRTEGYCYAHLVFRGHISAFKDISTYWFSCCLWEQVFYWSPWNSGPAVRILPLKKKKEREGKKGKILFIICNIYWSWPHLILEKCKGRKLQVSFAMFFFLHRLAKCSATLVALLSSPQGISATVPSYRMVDLLLLQGTAALLLALLRGTRNAHLPYQPLY